MAGLKDLTREALAAAFLNIDIDSSTLVDLSQPTVAQQQAVNAANTVELTLLIRELQPPGRGHWRRRRDRRGGEGQLDRGGAARLPGRLLRRAARLGHARPDQGQHPDRHQPRRRAHAGRDGGRGRASTSMRFADLSTVARDEYGLAGCVQHGASTLPEEAFHHFPANGTAEIHLATGFQNILYDEPGLPSELRAEMMAWCQADLRRRAQGRRERRPVPVQDAQEGAGTIQACAVDPAG